MARPLRRLLWPALAAALAAALLAGCGGDGDGGGEDRTEGLSAAEILSQSADAQAAAESFRIALDATGQVNLTDAAAVPGGGLLDGPLDISGEGPVDPPDRASIDARIEVSGLPLQLNLTRVGDEVFVGALGQDFRVDLPPAQVALLDLGDLYPTLVDWTAQPAVDGREEIDGTQTVKVTGRLDAQRALEGLAPLLGGDAPTAAEARAALREGTTEAWIGTGDLLPRRVHLVLGADLARVAQGVGAIDVDLTANLSAYGEPVDIQAPADPRELDTDELGSLFGG
jgi:LppX_LprAFG lipoprotein